MQLIGPSVLALFVALTPAAFAAEVVWLDPAPSAEEAARVASAAGATGDPLRPIDLRGAGAAFGAADDEAWRALDETLRSVRAYETRLDGELLIMRDLERPVQQITMVRGEADRDRLFAALAYQGFAVDRFFMDKLGTDERAATYRVDLAGTWVERPWLDAVALDPEREVTPYDIAEAPQRVAYEEVRGIVKGALPAEIRAALPAGMALSIDGRVPKPGATGGYKVVPGRHLVHAEKDGVVVARWDVRLAPAEAVELALPVPEAEWTAFVDGLRAGETPAVPVGLGPALTALGGEVWVARVDERGAVAASRITAAGVEPVDLPRASRSGGERAGGFSLAGTLGAGWMYSGDFYSQNPVEAPHAVATVNAVTMQLGVEVAWDWRLFRAVGGTDFLYTFGQYHFALYGDASTRVRVLPYLGAGIRWVQAAFGFLFPYHPVGTLMGGFPIREGVELKAGAYLGGPTQRSRAGGDPYNTEAIWGAWAGVTYRLRL